MLPKTHSPPSIALALLIAACGGSGTGETGGGGAAQSITVTVQPESAFLAPEGRQSFASAVTGATSLAVTWSVLEGSAGGTVAVGGVYTAPAAAGTYHVVARSVASGTTGQATVVVTAGSVVTVAINPGSSSLSAGGSTDFTCTVSGSTDTACTFSVAEAGGGTVSSSGHYVAPQASGTYHVVAASHADPGISATATITVLAAGTPTPTYYVDAASGSDGATGTSPSAAWKTLAKVSLAQLKAGDVVAFKRGGTYPGKLIVQRSGTALSPIQFTSYGTGALPVLDAGGSGSSPPFVVHVTSGASYVVIDGLQIQNVVNAGVTFDEGSQHNVVRNCEITNTGAGVNSFDAYNTITRNYIHDLRLIVNDAAPDNDYGAMAVNLTGANYNEISYNRMVRCRAPSIDYGYDGGAIEFWLGSSNVTVHHNWIEECDGFVEMGGDGSATISNITLSYNVIVNGYSNTANVIHVSGSYGIGSISGVKFENNTFVPHPSNTEAAIWFSADPSGAGVSYRNNLFVLNPGQPIAMSGRSGFVHEHNLFWRTDGSSGGLGISLDATDIAADPRMVSRATKDLHLQAGSPAIRAGTSLGYAMDFDDLAVPAAAPDIGAYQYSSSP
jgi:hypothetical protein